MLLLKPGDKVIYGVSGVCVIKGITRSPFSEQDTRDFYVLSPIGDMSSSIYAVAGTDKIRNLLTKEEIEKFLAAIPTLTVITVHGEKHRRDTYKEAIGVGSPEGCFRVLLTVDHRRRASLAGRGRISIVDSEYERIASNSLLGELGEVLGKTKIEAESLLREIRRDIGSML